MATKRYKYEYFCGANVSIQFNNYPLLDCAGISYSVLDSQAPVYGYSSRLFDAVAPGQKLVQGSFVVNFISPNWVWDVIEEGKEQQRQAMLASKALVDLVFEQRDAENLVDFDAQEWLTIKSKLLRGTPKEKQEAIKSIVNDGTINADVKSLMTLELNKLMSVDLPGKVLLSTAGTTDVTMSGPIEIAINFGSLKKGTQYILYGVHIVGHGSTIQIDENVILEEYNFFARDIVPWKLGGKKRTSPG